MFYDKVIKIMIDIAAIENNVDKKIQHIKKIIDSCENLKQLDTCRNLIKNLAQYINFEIKSFKKENKFVEFIFSKSFSYFLEFRIVTLSLTSLTLYYNSKNPINKV
jgi:hypothetical protein